MKWWPRKNGISVLIAAQNEEATIEGCIRSFLEFGDELIVVDNGSTDQTKVIVKDLRATYHRKIKFYDVPELPDLYQNRQFAFSHSSYRWVVRCDADFVAYTEGEYNILHFREELLATKKALLPKFFTVPFANLVGDFWHTGKEKNKQSGSTHAPGHYVPGPITKGGRPRIYEVFPGFKFQRLGRGEGVKYQRVIRRLKINLESPLWIHCNLKSDRSNLYRSERTNWRELGDYQRYPTLESFIRDVIPQKYGTQDVDEAAEIYMKKSIYPFLQLYEPEKHFPYPSLVRIQMRENPVYKINMKNNLFVREYLGVNRVP